MLNDHSQTRITRNGLHTCSAKKFCSRHCFLVNLHRSVCQKNKRARNSQIYSPQEKNNRVQSKILFMEFYFLATHAHNGQVHQHITQPNAQNATRSEYVTNQCKICGKNAAAPRSTYLYQRRTIYQYLQFYHTGVFLLLNEQFTVTRNKKTRISRHQRLSKRPTRRVTRNTASNEQH